MTSSPWLRGVRSAVLTLGAALGAICLIWTIGIALFGVRPLVFLSGSMSPAIAAGDVGFARSVPAYEVEVGDIISVVNDNGQRVTHRVVSIDTHAGTSTFRTKGDANNTRDAESYSLTSADVVVGHVPKVGYALTFAASPIGIGLGLSLLAASLWFGLSPQWRKRDHEADEPHSAAEQGQPGVVPQHVSAFGRSNEGSSPGRPRRARRLALLLPLLLSLVITGSTYAPTKSTLAYFSDTPKLSSPTNGIKMAPYFTCAQSMSQAAYGTQPWLHYSFSEAAGTQPNPQTPFFQDDSTNNRHGIYFVGPLSTIVTPTMSPTHPCWRDPSSTSVLLVGTSTLTAQYIRESPNSLNANGPVGARWNTFSINIWFKTNVGAGTDKAGVLAAYSVSSGDLDAATDRVLYLDASGHAHFEVYPGAYKFVSGNTDLADNKWHMATATLGPAGQCLYLGTPS